MYDSTAKQVIVNVVNRHKDQAIETDLQSLVGSFNGNATVSLIASDDVSNKPYTYEDRAAYPPKTEQLPAKGNTFHYVFPAHSFTQIVIGLAHP